MASSKSAIARSCSRLSSHVIPREATQRYSAIEPNGLVVVGDSFVVIALLPLRVPSLHVGIAILRAELDAASP